MLEVDRHHWVVGFEGIAGWVVANHQVMVWYGVRDRDRLVSHAVQRLTGDHLAVGIVVNIGDRDRLRLSHVADLDRDVLVPVLDRFGVNKGHGWYIARYIFDLIWTPFGPHPVPNLNLIGQVLGRELVNIVRCWGH